MLTIAWTSDRAGSSAPAVKSTASRQRMTLPSGTVARAWSSHGPSSGSRSAKSGALRGVTAIR